VTRDDARQWFALALLALAILGAVVGGVSCGVARWRECRRIHPWWYCASDDGGRS
jgi:hypothetical protein